MLVYLTQTSALSAIRLWFMILSIPAETNVCLPQKADLQIGFLGFRLGICLAISAQGEKAKL